MKKLFKLVLNLIPITLIILAIAGYYFKIEPWHNWCDRQINKVKGTWHIYNGDKALEKSREKDANISKELSTAIKLYTKGLKEYPEHYQARCNLANIYVLFEDYSSAVEEYKKALTYKPDYMECRMNLGILEADELSRYDEAIEEYQNVADLKPKGINIPYIYNNTDAIKENEINAYYNMGLAYRGKTLFTTRDRLKNNQYLVEAVHAYNKAVEAYNKHYKFSRDRNNYDVLYNLALTHHLLGNKKEAGLNYCKAIESSPMQYEAHINLGILLDSIGRHTEAIEEYNKAGLLIEEGDYETIKYLNNLINDSYKKNAIMKETNISLYGNNENKNQDEEITIYLKNGKFHIKEEKESVFKNRMKKCSSKKIFKDEM